MTPPKIKQSWESNDPWVIAQLLSFEQIREYEEIEIATIGMTKNV